MLVADVLEYKTQPGLLCVGWLEWLLLWGAYATEDESEELTVSLDID